jgi:putative ABC transport system substrate-binding protein
MNSRRKLVIALGAGALAVPLASLAQRQTKIPRIGLLFTGEVAGMSQRVDLFRKGLRDLGYVEGKNIILEYRYADGKIERLPKLAAELVRLPVDVIVTATSPAIHAARKLTSSIPIVFAISGSPMALGYIASLAHPGGNVTGLSVMAADLSAKRWQLLKEMKTTASRIAVLWNPDNGDMQSRMREVQSATKTLTVTIQSLEVHVPEDFAKAFARLANDRPDAMLVMADPLTDFHRDRIIENVSKLRLPAIYESRVFVDAGGLISYGPNAVDNYRRAADYVDKILKGANPANIPIEEPTRFELVLNMKTAKALGIKIPQSILVQATKVIE